MDISWFNHAWWLQIRQILPSLGVTLIFARVRCNHTGKSIQIHRERPTSLTGLGESEYSSDGAWRGPLENFHRQRLPQDGSTNKLGSALGQITNQARSCKNREQELLWVEILHLNWRKLSTFQRSDGRGPRKPQQWSRDRPVRGDPDWRWLGEDHARGQFWGCHSFLARILLGLDAQLLCYFTALRIQGCAYQDLLREVWSTGIVQVVGGSATQQWDLKPPDERHDKISHSRRWAFGIWRVDRC